MRRFGMLLVAALCGFAALLGAAIYFFDPKAPPPMASISAPFSGVDFSGLPPVDRYTARDGTHLAYRYYTVLHARKVVVLVHGSSGSSRSMHALAESLQQAGFSVYALDLRGHGDSVGSGGRGDIAYVGQLEDDLEDFVTQVLKGSRSAALVGFSSGGGFALRFAASSRQKLFAQYVLLSPYLEHDAPTIKSANRDWAAASVPRIVALSLLGKLGERWLGDLPVIRFAVAPENARYQTTFYSFRLWRNFKPHRDYAADIKAVAQRMDLLVGDRDELFDATAFRPLFDALRPGTDVTVVPGVGHIALTTSAVAAQALVEVLGR